MAQKDPRMSKEEKVINYPNSIETRVAILEVSVVNISQTLLRLENKIDVGFSDIKNEFKDVRTELKDIRKEIKSDVKWLLVIIAGLGAIMAHGFHWF